MKLYKIVLATLLLSCLILHARMLWFHWHHVASGSGDFIAYYTAGKILNSDSIRDLASFSAQEKVQRDLTLSSQIAFFPFYHAPYQAFLFAPLARLPYPTARLVWAAFNLLLLFIVLVVLVQVLDSKHKMLNGLILLATYPTWINLIQGQDAILSALILVAVFGCLKKQREGLAGGILALGLYKPQLVLPIGALALYGRQWRMARPFVILGFLLLGFSILMLSWQGTLDLIVSVHTNLLLGNLDRSSHMPNIRGLLITFLGFAQPTSIANVMILIVSVVLFGGCAYFCRDGFGSADPILDLKFALALVTTLLINPHSHAYELFLLLISLIILLDYVVRVKPQVRFFRESILFILFMICIPIVPNVLMSYDLISIYALPAVVLYCFIGLEIYTWQRRQAG